jgi:hypothetical protein
MSAGQKSVPACGGVAQRRLVCARLWLLKKIFVVLRELRGKKDAIKGKK